MAGGTFAMYSLLCQHTNVGGQARKLSERTAIADSQLSHFQQSEKPSRVRNWLEHNEFGQQALLFVVMMGTCMLIGDGVLTPAISGEMFLVFSSDSKYCVLLSQTLHAFNFVTPRLCEHMKFSVVWSLDAVLSAIEGIQTEVPSISNSKHILMNVNWDSPTQLNLLLQSGIDVLTSNLGQSVWYESESFKFRWFLNMVKNIFQIQC